AAKTIDLGGEKSKPQFRQSCLIAPWIPPPPHTVRRQYLTRSRTYASDPSGARLRLFSTALRSRLFRRSASGSGPRFCRVAPLRLLLHLWSDNAWSFPLVGSRPAFSVSRVVAGRSVPSRQGSSGPCRSGKLG